MSNLSTPIDLSRVPIPSSIEALDFESILDAYLARFIVFWDNARLNDPSLPAFTVGGLETDPVVIIGQVYSYLRLLDRQRVNDGIKALLAPYSIGSDLDNLVVRQGVERLIVVEADGDSPALMETDARLLERYLLSFSAAAAGSQDAYKFHALTAWPAAGDVKVVGRAIHGRRGDVDIIVTGANGDTPSDESLALVRAAVTATHVQPETTSVSVLSATRVTYEVDLTVEVPHGPDPSVIEQDVITRVTAEASARTFVDGEIPNGLLLGAAYGASVLVITDNSPVVIGANPYAVPVMATLTVNIEART